MRGTVRPSVGSVFAVVTMFTVLERL